MECTHYYVHVMAASFDKHGKVVYLGLGSYSQLVSFKSFKWDSKNIIVSLKYGYDKWNENQPWAVYFDM